MTVQMNHGDSSTNAKAMQSTWPPEEADTARALRHPPSLRAAVSMQEGNITEGLTLLLVKKKKKIPVYAFSSEQGILQCGYD